MARFAPEAGLPADRVHRDHIRLVFFAHGPLYAEVGVVGQVEGPEERLHPNVLDPLLLPLDKDDLFAVCAQRESSVPILL